MILRQLCVYAASNSRCDVALATRREQPRLLPDSGGRVSGLLGGRACEQNTSTAVSQRGRGDGVRSVWVLRATSREQPWCATVPALGSPSPVHSGSWG